LHDIALRTENYEIMFCIKEKWYRQLMLFSIYSLKNYYNPGYKSRVSPDIIHLNL
jgi:hypothetical protein